MKNSITKVQRFLGLAVVGVLKANETQEKCYTLPAAKALSILIEEHGDDANALKKAWKEQNIKVYRSKGVKKGDTLYGQLAKYASMLFSVSQKNEAVFEEYVEGKWVSLQGVYNALNGKKAKKAASKKPKTFAAKIKSIVENATPAQRAWMVKRIPELVKALA